MDMQQPRTFHLSGGFLRPQQEGSYYLGTNILNGFDMELLAEAFSSSSATVRLCKCLVLLKASLLESENPCNSEDMLTAFSYAVLKPFTTWITRERPTFFLEQSGKLNTVNDNKLPILSYLDLSAEKGHLQQLIGAQLKDFELDHGTNIWWDLTKSQIGVCYGMLGNNLPSATQVINLYNSNNIRRMRLYDPNQAALQALSGSNIEVMIGIQNSDLAYVPASHDKSFDWVWRNIMSFPGVKFGYIEVGNKVKPLGGMLAPLVHPALTNIHEVVSFYGLKDQIKVLTSVDMTMIGVSYPTNVVCRHNTTVDKPEEATVIEVYDFHHQGNTISTTIIISLSSELPVVVEYKIAEIGCLCRAAACGNTVALKLSVNLVARNYRLAYLFIHFHLAKFQLEETM